MDVLGIAAQAVGLARAALEEATRYAKTAYYFLANQFLSIKPSRFALLVWQQKSKQRRQLVHYAARLKEAGQPCPQ